MALVTDITVCDGKYTFQKHSSDHRVHVLRRGEPWLIIEAGSNAVTALMWELEEKLVKLREIRDVVDAWEQSVRLERPDAVKRNEMGPVITLAERERIVNILRGAL